MATKKDNEEQLRLIAKCLYELATGQQGLAQQTAAELEATLSPKSED